MTDTPGPIPDKDDDEQRKKTRNILRGIAGGKSKPDSETPPADGATNAGATDGSASAPDKGKPAGKKAASVPKTTNGRKQKVIDFGKFNHLLQRFTLIYGTDSVFDSEARIIMKISAMGIAHGTELVKFWKADPRRKMVNLVDVVFDPTNTCGPQCVNLFGGMQQVPMKGDVQPVLDLVDYLLSRVHEDEVERDAIRHWLMCWMAWPLQNIGAKLRTAVIMHGDEGAGKNFLFDIVTEMYGEYGVLVGQDELEDKFNEWRSGKMFVVGDEVSSRAELVHNKNRLKSLIGSESVQINPKGQPRRKEKNHINIVFLSNELQPLALDNSDRRYLVVYTPAMREFEYYKRLAAWRNAGGVAFFYEYLLNYDCAGFEPNAPAPWTEAKTELVDINRKSPERFWHDWHEGILDLPYHSCSMDQAYSAYQKYAMRIGDRFPMQANVFSRMVRRFAENQGAPVQIKTFNLNNPKAGRKAHRMLLVTEPKHDKGAAGTWAAEAVAAFQKHLSRYQGGGWSGPRTPSEAEQGDRGND